MNFLQPGLFAALAPLVLLPLAAHLLNRKFPVKVLFPDIERIRRSLAGRSRVAKWRHLVMLLLRTAAVVLILLAFLGPMLPRFGSENAPRADAQGRRVLLIADRSLSMEYQGGTQPSAAKRLLIEAGKILATLKGNDVVNAILASRQPEALLPDFTSAHDQVQTGLSALPRSMERADMLKAFALAGTLLGEEAAGAEIYVLSDFQRSGWADIAFGGLPEGARLFFVDTSGGERERPNTALLRVTPSAGVVSARETVRLDITVANYSPAETALPLEAIVDGRLTTPGEVKAGAWSTARTSLEIPGLGEGIHGIEVRTPEDQLAADNRRWVRVDVREREEILVLSDAAEDDSGVAFVVAALDPWDGASGPFIVRQATTGQVTAHEVGAASRIVLTGTKQLSGDLAQRLAAFLERGGGVLWFLDGESDAVNLMELDRSAGGGFAPFHLAGRLTTENFGGAPLQLARGDFDSRFLRLFRGAGRQSLALLEFYSAQRALPTGFGRVLLSFSDGMPALGSGDTGLGTAVFCNFAPSELASNLARQRLFPAWMQDMVKALKPDQASDVSQETGSLATAELWLRDLARYPLRAPDQSEVVTQTAVEGERVTVSFPAPLPGLYTQSSADALLWAAAVNVPAEEADLRGIDPDEIQRRSLSDGGHRGNFVSGARDYAEIHTGRPMFHWFLLAGAAVVALEMLLFRPFLRAAGHSQG
ncbi:MAG TPA: BatA and WFA domain-containing protein [Verrucomicrobiales bacterium]|nr:BatA and WFA domain-containing protein [Verrucomicrobiales bacterium]